VASEFYSANGRIVPGRFPFLLGYSTIVDRTVTDQFSYLAYAIMYAFSRRKFLKSRAQPSGLQRALPSRQHDNPLFRRGNASKGVQEIPTFCDICF